MFIEKFIPKIPVIINCDTGVDDAVALIMAIKSDRLDVRLITTDVGNISTKQSAKNCLNILDLIDAPRIDVCAGDGKCFKIERDRIHVHGKTGLGEYIFERHDRKIYQLDAVEKIYSTLMASEEKITIISLSPMSNLAKLFAKYPECKEKIEKLIIMAGTIEESKRNEIPYAEFNVTCDPEAAEEILESGVPIDFVPMEMGHTAYLSWQDVFKTKNMNFAGKVLEIIFRTYKDRHVKNGIATHDGAAVAYAMYPELFKVAPVKASVKYYDSLGTGVLKMTFGVKPNARTCYEIDIKKFKKLYFRSLKKCK